MLKENEMQEYAQRVIDGNIPYESAVAILDMEDRDAFKTAYDELRQPKGFGEAFGRALGGRYNVMGYEVPLIPKNFIDNTGEMMRGMGEFFLVQTPEYVGRKATEGFGVEQQIMSQLLNELLKEDSSEMQLALRDLEEAQARGADPAELRSLEQNLERAAAANRPLMTHIWETTQNELFYFTNRQALLNKIADQPAEVFSDILSVAGAFFTGGGTLAAKAGATKLPKTLRTIARATEWADPGNVLGTTGDVIGATGKVPSRSKVHKTLIKTEVEDTEISFAASMEVLDREATHLRELGLPDDEIMEIFQGYSIPDIRDRVTEQAERAGVKREEYLAAVEKATTDQPRFDETVERILKEQPDKRVEKRVRGLYYNIKEKEPVNLIGHRIETPAEAAVLAQPYRNPLIETTRIVYLKDGHVIAHEGWTLNRSTYTTGGNIGIIEDHMERLGADSLMTLHNHPSGVAHLSEIDLDTAESLRKHFKDTYRGEVVIDSGEFATLWWDQNGKRIEENGVELDPTAVMWDTRVSPEKTWIKRTDPLYVDSQPEAVTQFQSALPWGRKVDEIYFEKRKKEFAQFMSEKTQVDADYFLKDEVIDEHRDLFVQWSARRAVAALGAHLKTPNNWTTLVFSGVQDRITATVEYKNLHKLKPQEVSNFIAAEAEKWSGYTVHVIVGPGDWYSSFDEGAAPFSALKFPDDSYRPGIASVWIDGEPLGSIKATDKPIGRMHSAQTQDIEAQVEVVAPEGVNLHKPDQDRPKPDQVWQLK